MLVATALPALMVLAFLVLMVTVALAPPALTGRMLVASTPRAHRKLVAIAPPTTERRRAPTVPPHPLVQTRVYLQHHLHLRPHPLRRRLLQLREKVSLALALTPSRGVHRRRHAELASRRTRAKTEKFMLMMMATGTNAACTSVVPILPLDGTKLTLQERVFWGIHSGHLRLGLSSGLK